MKTIRIVFFALVISVFLSSFVLAQENSSTFFMLDTDLATAGYQGVSEVQDIGAGENVGFAIYLKNFDQLRAFDIDLKWDATKGSLFKVFGQNLSGPAISGMDLTVNGSEITLVEEANALSNAEKSPGEVDVDGHYFVKYAELGGTAPASEEFSLAFLAILQTSSDMTTSDSFNVTVTVTVDNDEAMKKSCGTRYFFVNLSVDVKNATWKEVKEQFKDF